MRRGCRSRGESAELLTGTTYGSAPPSTPSGWVGRFLDGVAPAALPAGSASATRRCCLTGVTSSPLAIYALSGFGVYPTDDSEARYAAYEKLQQRRAGDRCR
jgi:hypothetical protein